MRGVATLADKAEPIAGGDDPCVRCGAMQILTEVFEHCRIVWRDGGEVIEGLVDARYQAGGCDIVAEDPAIDYLGEERPLGNELPNRWGIFSCPSGMKVSSSRVPPPKVTTTAFCPLRMAMARRERMQTAR